MAITQQWNFVKNNVFVVFVVYFTITRIINDPKDLLHKISVWSLGKFNVLFQNFIPVFFSF